MWFTETAWPPIIGFAIVAACFLAAALSAQRTSLVWPIPLLVIISVATYIIEQRIVTERERVEASVFGVVDAFQKQDVEGTLRYFSQNATLLRGIANGAIRFVEVKEDLRITDVSVTTTNNDTRATSHFRANGSFIVAGNDVGHQPTRWQVSWQKEGGEWRIINVERLDPIRGDPMPWDAQQATLN